MANDDVKSNILNIIEELLKLQRCIAQQDSEIRRITKVLGRYKRGLQESVALRDGECMNPDCQSKNESYTVVTISYYSHTNIWTWITLCEDCRDTYAVTFANHKKYCQILEKKYSFSEGDLSSKYPYMMKEERDY